MKHIICFILLVFSCYSQSVLRPTGVPLSKAGLYLPSDGKFTCFDGSATIPFSFVNDDYCDCTEDGSDEPGTSACPFGKFYCNNIGHTPKIIPSSHVNDGICDCCDGSDEYETKMKCKNECMILGKAAREERQQRLAMYKEGNRIRLELCNKAQTVRKENQERILELKRILAEAEMNKEEKSNAKVLIEVEEKDALEKCHKENAAAKAERENVRDQQLAMEHFKGVDTNDDLNIDVQELSQYRTKVGAKEVVLTLEDAETLLEDESAVDPGVFVSDVWPRLKELIKAKSETPHPESDVLKEGEELEHEDRSVDDHKEEEDEEVDIESHKNDEEDNCDENTQIVIREAEAARAEYEEAERHERDVQREIKQLEDSLRKDYGPDYAFSYMDGECYELTDTQYTYRICPFDTVTQRTKQGGSEIRLGTWGSWIGDKYQTMLYNNGQTCWNGPQRQMEVKLVCSTVTEVAEVSEPNRCMYVSTLKTPAACEASEILDQDVDRVASLLHDPEEL